MTADFLESSLRMVVQKEDHVVSKRARLTELCRQHRIEAVRKSRIFKYLRAQVFLTSRAGDSMRETGAVSLVAPSTESAPATSAIAVFPDRYSYAPDADPSLAGFSIDEDRQNGLLQPITDAQAVPGAVILETSVEGLPGLQTSAIRNPDETIALHVFNEGDADVA